MADLYETLGVSRDANGDEIKRAYRELARELHPDINPDTHVQERFKEVTAAYDVLSDSNKRQQYDMGGNPFGGGAGGFNGGFGFSDIMDAFFGEGGQQRGPRSRARAGQDALIRVEVSLEEACFGTEREITVESAVRCERPCASASIARFAKRAQSVVATENKARNDGELVRLFAHLFGEFTKRSCTHGNGLRASV